ncbi:Protocadherin-9 [Echinococcus granulosus]|nr:Protocadherin-9 [Echinococcus granulosus]
MRQLLKHMFNLFILAQLFIVSTQTSNLQHLTYVIQEEVPRGTKVGNLAEDILQIYDTYSTHGEKSPVNLMITNLQDIGPQHFAIDMINGYLIVTSRLDREVICPDSSGPGQARFPYSAENGGGHPMLEKIHSPGAPDSPCTLTLRVVYTPEQNEGGLKDPILLTVNIIVADVNDHVPVFPQTRINLELGEVSAVPGETTINLPTASDPDAGSNGTLSYWLEHVLSQHGHQHLNSTIFPFRLEGLVNGDPLRLRLNQPLDYEKLKSYEILLCVEDHGTPNSLSSRLRIHIDVLDENDNIPTFTRPNYFIIINESLPHGSVLLDLHAQDLDSGQNGQVSFELPAPMTEESKVVQQYFDVRTITPGYAKLFIRQSPDLDTGIDAQSSTPQEISIRRSRDFTLRVIATDNGSPRRHTSEATVTVRVLDVNDMTPKISVNFLATQGPQYQGNMFFRGSSPQKVHGVVMENVGRSVIAFVTVRDLDSGPWGQVACRTDNGAFKLVPISGSTAEFDSFEGPGEMEPRSANRELSFKLTTQKPFDREEIQQVPFRIICIDNVYKTGQTQTFVQDVSPPSIAAPSISDANGGKEFTIVTDRAKQLTAIALVSIRIFDENDCPPEFSQAIYTFSVGENVPDFTNQPSTKSEGKPIGNIQARDRDLDPVLTYTLLSNPQDAFKIDSKSGTLHIVRPFDREAFLISKYEGIEVKRSLATNESTVVTHLRAQVSDGKHTAHTEIQVTITDVNDCPPIFERTTYEFFVEENCRPLNGHPIGTVLAHDSDMGLNGKIVYRLQPITDHDFSNSTSYPRDYNPARHFKIDPNTGNIHALHPLDREQYIHHIFHVIAIDTSDGLLHQQTSEKRTQFTATTTVTVIVNDENDNAPTITFPASHTTLRVEVGAPAGQQIFTVTATDPDAGENGTVRYSLSQSTPLVAGARVNEASAKGAIFSIDEQAGMVLLTEQLPSTPTKYLLTISAHDLGSIVQRNTSIAVIIHAVTKNQLEASVGYKGDGKMSVVWRGETAKCSLGDCPPGVRVPQTRHRAPGGSHGEGGGRVESDGGGGEGGQGRREDSRLAPLLPLPPALTTVQPFAFLTDRIIIFVLSSIFVVLLVVTVVLILLIRRRRFIEINTNHGHKDGPKVSQIQNNIAREGLPCATNALQLIRNDEVPGSKAVFYRTGLPSDGTSHSDSDGRSIFASETYPVNGEDPYTLLKPLSKNQGGPLSSNKMGFRSFNHCFAVSPFPALVPMQSAAVSLAESGTQDHTAVLYSTSGNYSDDFAHIYPVCTTTRIVSHQAVGGARGTSPSGNGNLLAGLLTQPRRCPSAAVTAGTATYTEMSGQLLAAADSEGDIGKCEYQLLLQQKMPVIMQRRSSAGQSVHGEKPIEFSLSVDAWPSTSQGSDELMSASTTKVPRDEGGRHKVKSATLQPMDQGNSLDWNSDLEDTITSTTPLQPHKVVKFSASSISLNKLTPLGDGLSKTAQSSYV